MDDLEQFYGANNLIIRGLKTRHWSYASVVATAEDITGRRGAEETEDERESLEQQEVNFLDSKGISIDYNDIKGLSHPA